MSSVPSLRSHKGAENPLVMVTAYDAPSASMADAAGVDIILVGDTLGAVVLGYEDTLQVTLDDMVHHTAAVARAKPKALIVADMPWLTYHTDPYDAVLSAGRLIRAGASAVKLEGGHKRAAVIEALVNAEIPVVGHLGLTPQSVKVMGGYRVQGRDITSAEMLLDDAVTLQDLGCFVLVLEGIPGDLAAKVTATVQIPTIGIGAGSACDGQVLVWHDLLGYQEKTAKFVRRYADLKSETITAIERWADDVRSGRFPGESETYT